MKKVISLCLVLLLIVGVVPLMTLSAVETSTAYETLFMDYAEVSENVKYATTYQILETQLVEAWSNQEKSPVDISDLGISVDEISEYYFGIAQEHPEIFYLDIGFSYTNIGDTVLSVVPNYYASAQEIEIMKVKFNRAINDALSVIRVKMSSVEKALAIHDYLCAHAEYDVESYNAGQNNPQSVPAKTFRAYGVLVDGVGVCQSYSTAYKLLLDTYCGVNVEFCSSSDLNHVWNKVEINGKYYQVDVTWDDPISDRLGNVGHGYFLKSDSAFPNHGTYPDIPACNDTTFDTGTVWEGVIAKMNTDGTNFYYISSDGIIKKYNFADNISADIKDISDVWYVNPAEDGLGAYWTQQYSGLELVGDTLYFNTANEIHSIKTDGSEETLIKPLSIQSNYAYGIKYANGELLYTFKNSPNSAENILVAKTITPAKPEWDIYISGVNLQQTTLYDAQEGSFYSVIRNSGSDDVLGIIEVDVLVDNVQIDNYFQNITLASGGMEISSAQNKWTSFFGTHSVKFEVSYPTSVSETAIQNNMLKSRFKVIDE